MFDRTVAVALAVAGAIAAVAILAAAPAEAQVQKRVSGVILDVAGDVITIDRGKESGVAERMVFDVYQKARVIRLPMTGETIYVQDRVVAQLVVVDVDRTVSKARTMAPDDAPGMAEKPAAAPVRKGDLVISNPFTIAKNMAPFIRLITSTAMRAEFGTSVTIKLDASDEKGDQMYFTFTASGGLLSRDRSAVPEVVWTAPMTKGKYRIVATAIDTGGNKKEAAIEIEGLGFVERRTVYEPRRVLADHRGPFKVVRDIAFDEVNQCYVWDGDGTKVYGINNDWDLDAAGKPALVTNDYSSPHYYEIERLVVRGGDAFFVDSDKIRAVRARLGPKMFQEPPIVVYGTKGAFNGQFEKPVDIALDPAGDVYVLDEAKACVQIFAVDGTFVASIGAKADRPGGFTKPVALATAVQDGALYVLDDGRKKVSIFREKRFAAEFSVGGPTDTFLDVKVDPFTGRVCVLEEKSGQVRCYDRNGVAERVFGAKGEGFGQFRVPKALKFDQQGSLYVIDDFKVIHRCDSAAGRVVARWGGTDFTKATRVAAGAGGEVALLLPGLYQVVTLDKRGWISGIIGGEGKTPGKFQEPVDVAVDADGNVYVADADRGDVQQFAPNGSVLRALGKSGSRPEEFEKIVDLTTDPDRQFVCVLDQRDAWNVKVFDIKGALKAALPGVEDECEDALQVAMTRDGRVHVGVDSSSDQMRSYETGPALRAASPIVDGKGASRFKVGGNWEFKDVDAPSDLVATNTGFVLGVRSKDQVVVLNLARSDYLSPIKEPKVCPSPIGVAADDYDRIYVLDGDRGRVVEFGR